MILAVVKAAALQFFGAVLPVIMAGLGMAVILVVFPPLTFQPILIVLSSRMIAIPVVPLAILAIPVVPMLAVATGLFCGNRPRVMRLFSYPSWRDQFISMFWMSFIQFQ